MVKKVNRWLQLLLLGWSLGLPALGLAESLRIATEGAYPPFSFINAQGQLAGFDVDIAQAICRALDARCEIVAVPWKDLLPGLIAGRYEVIVASMAKTPERERLAEFTDPYYRTRDVFIGRPDSGITRVSPETARGKILVTQADTIYADYLRDHYQDIATLRFTGSMTDAFSTIARREADFVLSDNLSAFEFLRSEAGQPLDIIGAPININEIAEAAHIQVRKGNIRLRDEINAALRNVWLDGGYHKINARYFPFSIY